MHHEHSFTWLSLIPGLAHYSQPVVMAIFVATALVLVTFLARIQLMARMKTADQGVIPEAKMTFRNFFEIVAEMLYKMTESVIGEHDAPKYFPVIGSIFIFIFVSNLMGLIPGFPASTSDLNTTLALGAFVFIYYNLMGLKEGGLGYIKHFFGPVMWLAPLMLVIEIASHIFRPLSLALRLRGNINGDHVVLGVFNDLTPYFIPTIFYGLGLFVCFVQAFVFSLMTMVYVSLATAHDDH